MNSSLREQLDQALTNHLANKASPPKLAIVGIGNELNGDDGAGLLVIRTIQKKLGKTTKLLLVEGSIAPENFSATIRHFQPDWVWLIDAAELGAAPGIIQIFDSSQIVGISAFSHSLPLSVFAQFLTDETGAIVTLFGIQPGSVEYFSSISKNISSTSQALGRQLANWLKENILD